jgi:hypothetical protein
MAPVLKQQRSRHEKACRPHSDRGSALVMAAIVSTVAFALAAVVLSFSNHQSTASNNDRLRQQAVDAATAGLVVADSALTKALPTIPSDWQTLPDGSQFKIAVTSSPDGNGFRRILTSSGRAPATGAASRTERTMTQVVELDPVTFTYGVFIEDGGFTGPTWEVKGDLYTNGSLTLDKNNTFTGNISAQKNINSQATVSGSLSANGDVIVGGKTTTSNVYAGGTITGCSPPRCKANLVPKPVPAQGLPTFAWPNPSYPPGSYTAFSPSAHEGASYTEGNLVISQNLVLTGDMTIIASGNITLPGNVQKAPGITTSAQFTVISTSLTGKIFVENNFDFMVPTLIFTQGTFDGTKRNINHAMFNGALYVGNVDLHANNTFVYAPVKSTGFNWVGANPQNFTIRHISTRETTGVA